MKRWDIFTRERSSMRSGSEAEKLKLPRGNNEQIILPGVKFL